MIAMYIRTKTIRPISLAITILVISIMSTIPIYKASARRWISFILIITFSSGIITLFIYTASLLNNEVNKTKKNKTLMLIIIIAASIPQTQQTKTQRSIKNFSKRPTIIIMASILIITIIAIVRHGHRPHQTLNSSF